MIPILVKVPREVADKIDSIVGAPVAYGSPGAYGTGRAGWIRDKIYAELGYQDENRPKDMTQALERVNLSLLNDTEKLVVQLRKRYPTNQVVRYLTQEKIPPMRGKKWHSHQIENIVHRAIATTYAWLVNQLEDGRNLEHSV